MFRADRAGRCLFVLDRDPDLLDALVNLGQIAYLDRRLEEAVALWRRALRLRPKDRDVQGRLEKAERAAKGQDAFEKKALALCKRLAASLDEGKPATAIEPNDEDEALVIRDMFLLTNKPSFFVAGAQNRLRFSRIGQNRCSSLDLF